MNEQKSECVNKLLDEQTQDRLKDELNKWKNKGMYKLLNKQPKK